MMIEKIQLKHKNKGYEIIKKICNTKSTGEILFFSTGAPEIKRAVKYLNEIWISCFRCSYWCSY